MSSGPKISVVIATYNTATHLPAAIESVLGQTYNDIELCIVDDGSTDNTKEIIRTYLSDRRVIVVSQPNQGQAVAKNRGIAECSASIIGFCDADDMWLPDKLALQVPKFNDAEVGVVFGRSLSILEDGHPTSAQAWRPCSGWVCDKLFETNFVPFGTALVRRDCFKRSGVFDVNFRMGIDWDLWLRISTKFKFDYVDDPVYTYRIWEQQMSNDWRGRYMYAEKIMKKFLAENPGMLPESKVNHAWSQTFANKARHRSKFGGEHIGAIADCLKAIRIEPANSAAWRTLAAIPLNAIR